LEHIVTHDALTGLGNRTLLVEHLRSAMASARDSQQCVGVLHLDLDDFKKVNDQLGSAAADQLLIALAARLRENVRDSDVIGRLGGDEFAVILPALASENAANPLMERLLSATA